MSCLIYFWLQIIQPTYIIKDIKIMAKMRLNIRNDKFCLSQDLVSFVDDIGCATDHFVKKI